MIEPEAGGDVPPVADNELLARYIFNSNEVRADGTVKPKLFMPYSRVELSVNRHRECTEEEIWSFGQQVATARKLDLRGRSDIHAINCRIEPLSVNATPLPRNPNHADIAGYPASKEDQKSLAQKLAAAAGKKQSPS